MAESTPAGEGEFETREDAGDGGPGVHKLWITALDLADKDEKEWRKSAESARKRYRDDERRTGSQFNILYSSVETQLPALYNSTPHPDVRRRFGDPDPVSKVAGDTFERTLSHCLDEYDFDAVMTAVTHDSLLPGRGVGLVNYDSVMDEADEQVAYETVRAEHVQWDDFRRGPGKQWEDVAWLAVRYRITRDEAIALNPKVGATIPLDHTEKDANKDGAEKDAPTVFKRLTVWKIWDKPTRTVVFIAPSYTKGPLAVEPDLLKLEGFFPFPRPINDITDPSSMIPLVPFDMYRDQAEELDRVTRRISVLVNCLRWRGIRPAQITELDRLKDAEDGELIPSESAAAVLAMSQTGGDLDRAIWLMPIDKLIGVIRELVIQREAIKQVIFEISGLADVMRGQTDANETLGAQQLKAQWGSQRMQRRQREVQRFARDLLRIKAEIIGEHYSVETLAMMTGIQLPTPEQKQAGMVAAQQAQAQQQPVPDDVQELLQTPTWPEVKAVMADDALRSFRVDIETDSTIQADLGLAQQNMSGFVEGLGAFANAIGPAIQSGDMPKDVAADLLVGFSRNFKLGRQAEDAIERWGRTAQQSKGEPDPAMLAVQAEQQKMQAEMQAEQQKMQIQAQADQAKAQAQMQLDQAKAEADIALKQQQAQADAALAQSKLQQDAVLQQARLEAEMALKREGFVLDSEIKGRNQAIAEDEIRAKKEAEEAASLAPALDEVRAAMEQLAAILGALQAERDAPVSITPIRENGRVVGAVRQQGERTTEVRLV